MPKNSIYDIPNPLGDGRQGEWTDGKPSPDDPKPLGDLSDEDLLERYTQTLVNAAQLMSDQGYDTARIYSDELLRRLSAKPAAGQEDAT